MGDKHKDSVSVTIPSTHGNTQPPAADSQSEGYSEVAKIDALEDQFPKYAKYASLVLLTLQNSAIIILMRYAQTQEGGNKFRPTTAVVMQEFIKAVVALCLVFAKDCDYSLQKAVPYLRDNLFQPMDNAAMIVPSILYTLNNNILYIGVKNLDAATFQVTFQLKIFTTAILSVLMLGRSLSRPQWLALVVLFLGVSMVQVNPENSNGGGENHAIGFVAVVVYCTISGFASVYFEKILKTTPKSIWVRNIQLGCYGVVIGLLGMELKDGESVHSNGFFYGYNAVVWSAVFMQSFGGIMVAIVVKYADNILKGFATSSAIILSFAASVILFEFQVTIFFILGSSLVICSVIVYSKYQ